MNAMVAEKMTNIEWLGQQLRAKTANYEADTPPTNEIPVNWEDRCGAIALMPNDETKAYASILVWGDYRDNTDNYSVVTEYISDYLWCMVQGEMDKQRESFDMPQFCKHIARMELFYSLRPKLREYHTLKGRLVFSGIDYIEPNTYSKRYAWLGNAVEFLLNELNDEVEHYAGQYRKNLRKLSV